MIFKFKLVENLIRLEETHFIKNQSFLNHFNKHVAKDYSTYFLEMEDELFEPTTPEQYDEYAHILSQEPVSTSDVDSDADVVGFVGTDNRIIKYRKSLSELVVYKAEKNDAVTISYYKLKTSPEHSRYRKIKNKYYLREIDPLDDFYNI